MLGGESRREGGYSKEVGKIGTVELRRFVSHVIQFIFNDTATAELYTLSLRDALPISLTGYFVPGRVGSWVWPI